ncbi:excisionase family DNA-binding protein [Brevundimonas sp.]|uniref:excisionase family DNA-binding protein n=1 Tax=Brevundimonas sp. TaxID=1871086 RepID=UPI002737EC7C|nr:excisionase family DNA-binding protein [Brevundimonas sp.]MDP3803473.1 excisionase family DNA-binding protein [Brevundimonas sp.]
MHTTPPALMSIQAFCAWAGIGRTKVYEEIEAGRLSTVKVGRRRLVPMQQAQLWLEGLADG